MNKFKIHIEIQPLISMSTTLSWRMSVADLCVSCPGGSGEHVLGPRVVADYVQRAVVGQHLREGGLEVEEE